MRRLSTAIGILMLAAIAVRVYGLNEPVVTFHATRHYRSALLARACYYDRAPHIAPQAKAVADANREMQPAGELPVMEWLACSAYLAVGAEHVAIPRGFAIGSWVIGALPLAWLAAKFTSPAATLIAVALYLFMPYGIIATRNFQPDALMTLVSLVSVMAAVRHHLSPSRRTLLWAAALVALAGLVKPMSVFLTIPPVLALAWLRRGEGQRRALQAALLIITIGLLPPALYYGYGAVAGTLAQDQMRMRFVPGLIGTGFFWRGLFEQASRVTTIPLLALAFVGAVRAASPGARVVLLSLFAGYAAFAVAFTYHMPTHDYYHLPYIALAALGAAALIARIERTTNAGPRASMAVAAVVAIAIVILGTRAAWPRLQERDAPERGRMYAAIGEDAEHDTKVVFLDAEYGYALMYHGQISGDAWPSTDDLEAEALNGTPPIDAETRFERDFAGFGPRFFVVTDLASLRASPDLQAMLTRLARPVRTTSRYHVYRFASH